MSDSDNIVDAPRLKQAQIVGFDFTPTNKALRLQSRGPGVQGDYRVDATYSPRYGEWCLIAPPLAPTTDGNGNISATTEGLFLELGDDNVPIGTRDVRASKYAQDVQGGEACLINTDGYRLLIGHKVVALTGGGGFLSFDVNKKTVGLAGIPAAPGSGAPYLAIDTASIGLVSATGAASICVKGSGVTASGGSCALDFGGITIGKGAADGVVLQSLLASAMTAFLAQLNAHTHGGVTTGAGVSGPPVAPMNISMVFGSTRVKCA